MPCPIYRLPPYTVAPAEHVLSQVVPWNVLGYGIPDIWKETKGEGIKVAVIDTGIDLNHPDLKDQIADAQDFTGSPYGPQDRQGHGTHVSGTIAAIDNGVGVIGVAPSAKLLVAKVLGDDGSGASNNVAAGIMWAISKGADIISMSLGGPQDSSDIDQAVMAALAAGIQVVCAAGNDGQTNSVNWPAKLSPTTGVIAVAAVDRDGHLAPYSSLGPEVDIAGPGSDILSDAPGGGLATMSGTSMATPFVSGSLALYLSRLKAIGAKKPLPADVKQELHNTAQDAGPTGRDTGYGWGLIRPASILLDADKQAVSNKPQPPVTDALAFRIPNVTLGGFTGSLVFQRD